MFVLLILLGVFAYVTIATVVVERAERRAIRVCEYSNHKYCDHEFEGLLQASFWPIFASYLVLNGVLNLFDADARLEKEIAKEERKERLIEARAERIRQMEIKAGLYD